MAKAMYDPWSKIVTKNGYAGDEVISALQKSIRRAKEEDACMFAYEMYISSPQLLEKMWRRLLTISVEDIGMGDPMAAVLVNNLYQMSKNFEYADGDQARKDTPQMKVDNDYKERYAKILEEYDPENVVDTAFTFNGWQF